MDEMSKALSYICTRKIKVTYKAEEWEKLKKKREKKNTNSNDTNELLKQSVAYTKQQSTFF